MRKINKPTLKHTTLVGDKSPVEKETIEALSPFGDLNKLYPEYAGKLIYVDEAIAEDEDNFRPPTQFFVITALGGRLFFKTNSRAKAQEMCDRIFGGKYTVKVVIRAAVR